jgi:hypothetical protein
LAAALGRRFDLNLIELRGRVGLSQIGTAERAGLRSACWSEEARSAPRLLRCRLHAEATASAAKLEQSHVHESRRIRKPEGAGRPCLAMQAVVPQYGALFTRDSKPKAREATRLNGVPLFVAKVGL